MCAGLPHGPALLTKPRLWANLGRGFFLPSFGPRQECTGCGIVGADARPNWTKRPGRESLTGTQWRWGCSAPVDGRGRGPARLPLACAVK
jgi:hypothetical protein